MTTLVLVEVCFVVPCSPVCRLSLVLLCLAAGCAPTSFTFDVTSDMRQFTPPEHPGLAYFAGVASAIRELRPGAFMVCIGDLDPPNRVRATLDETIGTSYVWYPVIGNHEIEKPEYMAWLRASNDGGRRLPGIVHPGPPAALETCYSVDHANAHIVVLNEYYDGTRDDAKGGDVGDALYAWLAEDLASTRARTIFVVGHEPYLPVADLESGVTRHKGDSLDLKPEHAERFWRLLRRHRVAAYLCGHTHSTSVAKMNGVWQIDAGHARGLGDKATRSTFVRIRVSGERVDCDVYRSVEPNRTSYELAWSERLR